MTAPMSETAPALHEQPASFQRWDRASQWPLAVAALVFLACYSWLVLQPGMPRARSMTLTLIDYVTWLAFVIDYVVRLALARPRGRWFVRNLAELIIVGLPVLRPLRLLRLVSLVRVLNRRATASFHGRVGLYVLVSLVLVVYSGSLAELAAERGARGANIETFGSALWWAMTTVTTVGYGDYYPVTTVGRLVAVAMMLAGIALIGTVTASIASYLVDRVRSGATGSAEHSREELRAMRSELAELKVMLSRQHERPEPSG